MIRAELKTARLTLRPVAPEDEGAVVACLNDLEVTGWLAVVPHPYSPADFRAFQQDYAVPGHTFAVGDAQGFVGILGIEDRSLGYWFAPASHGLGYATEAARAVLAEHFADDPADIASGYYDGNARSANVLRKLGFVENGRGMKFCRALGVMRAHVDMVLTQPGFIAALPWEAASKRLTYRPLLPVDAPALHEIACIYDVTRQLGPRWPWPADVAFTATRSRPYVGNGFAWGLFLDGQLIGSVAVTEGELGYALHPDHHRQGLATEACLTALARAFGPVALQQVIASVWADNAASLGLLAKLGFTVTGHDLGTNACRPDLTPGLQLLLTAQAFTEAANIPPGVRGV